MSKGRKLVFTEYISTFKLLYVNGLKALWYDDELGNLLLSVSSKQNDHAKIFSQLSKSQIDYVTSHLNKNQDLVVLVKEGENGTVNFCIYTGVLSSRFVIREGGELVSRLRNLDMIPTILELDLAKLRPSKDMSNSYIVRINKPELLIF